MIQLNKSLRIHKKTIFIGFFRFATVKRSYYDILGIQPNCSQKQLRKNFLEKARLYHPDHNSSKEALQEFKLLKEAYQTLKDPQKKHMYDSGITQTSDEVAPVHNQEVKQGRKYYENKWYGFQKPKQSDTRDQYYQAKAQFFHDKPTNHLRYVMTFTAIVLAVFGYDLIGNRDSDRSKRISEVKKVVDDSVSSSSRQTKKQMMLQRYIERRAEVNKVTDLD